ncbi:hypothetical protein ANN_01383 [Periplaneta americana]|uniref:Uncharacterized protein n=1 Tax=Periplaneta americana TaxID=6978 RepID=A0ABQ8TV26_PERAM|nr:hypothetical protein ANN_01383 [Periplaneta americana]
MAGLCEGGNDPPGSLKTISLIMMVVTNRLIIYGDGDYDDDDDGDADGDDGGGGDTVMILVVKTLPSISGGRLLYPQPEDAPCRGDRDPPYMGFNN